VPRRSDLENPRAKLVDARWRRARGGALRARWWALSGCNAGGAARRLHWLPLGEAKRARLAGSGARPRTARRLGGVRRVSPRPERRLPRLAPRQSAGRARLRSREGALRRRSLHVPTRRDDEIFTARRRACRDHAAPGRKYRDLADKIRLRRLAARAIRGRDRARQAAVARGRLGQPRSRNRRRQVVSRLRAGRYRRERHLVFHVFGPKLESHLRRLPLDLGRAPLRPRDR
jgi:hypothetical protein